MTDVFSAGHQTQEVFLTPYEKAKKSFWYFYWWYRAVRRRGLVTDVGVNRKYGSRLLNSVDAVDEWRIDRATKMIAQYFWPDETETSNYVGELRWRDTLPAKICTLLQENSKVSTVQLTSDGTSNTITTETKEQR